jgi:hypothetical protein
MKRSTCRTLGVWALAAALCPAPVGAQTVARSFDDLRSLVKPGQTVHVIDTTGREVEGRIIELSSSLVLQVPQTGRRELAEPDVRTVRLRGNAVKKGLGWGLGIGAASGLALGWYALGDCHVHCERDIYRAVFGFAGIGGVIGAAVGLAIPTHRLIYERPATAAVTVSPVVTGRQKGVLVSVRF